MAKFKTKNLLDFIPFVIITISTIVLIVKSLSEGIVLQPKHTVGFVLLGMTGLLFCWRHKAGVLALGLTLLLGLMSILSFSPAITITTVYKGSSEAGVPLFSGQLIFLLWLIIHFTVSARHYTGILTAKYWDALRENKDVTFD